MTSALDRIRARRGELERRKSLDLVVPGYNGLLGIRYRTLSDDELDGLLKGVGTEEMTISRGIESTLDVLIAACECVLIVPDDESQLAPFVDDDDGAPYRLDLRLADRLGFEAETARQVARGLFSPEGTQPLAAGSHGEALTAWMKGETSAIDRALLGE